MASNFDGNISRDGNKLHSMQTMRKSSKGLALLFNKSSSGPSGGSSITWQERNGEGAQLPYKLNQAVEQYWKGQLKRAWKTQYSMRYTRRGSLLQAKLSSAMVKFSHNLISQQTCQRPKQFLTELTALRRTRTGQQGVICGDSSH